MSLRKIFYDTLKEAGNELSGTPEGQTPQQLANALHMDDRRHREALMGWAILQLKARDDVDRSPPYGAEDAA